MRSIKKLNFCRVTQLGFVALSLWALWFGWSNWEIALPQYKRETLIVPWVVMMLLAFPCSLIFQTAIIFAPSFLSMEWRFESLEGWVLTEWLPMFVLGLLQWFILLPWLLRKLRR